MTQVRSAKMVMKQNLPQTNVVWKPEKLFNGINRLKMCVQGLSNLF